MAELTFVRYQPGDSLIHRLDVRVKLLALVLLALSTARADFGDLIILGLLIAAGIFFTRPLFTKRFSGILWWLGFLLVVFAARALTTAGTPLLSFRIFTVTREGVFEGLQVAGRLAAIGLLGLLLVASTRSVEIKAGVQWLLRPVPGPAAGRVATMLGLLLRFIPMIFEQAQRTSEAIKARGIQRRRNPLYRIKFFALPLLRRLFEDTDNLILAMQARGYQDRRTDPPLSFKTTDAVVGLGLVLVSVWIWF